MRVCAIDFETNGLDTSLARITEYGATVFTAPDATYEDEDEEQFAEPLSIGGFVFEPSYGAQSEEIVEVTGITDEMLQASGKPFKAFIEHLETLGKFDAFLAHNAHGFDKPLFLAELARHQGEIEVEVYERLRKLPWICSIEDVEYKIRARCRVLSHLALEHGIIVDPSTLHRASADTELLVKLMRTAKVELKKALEHSLTPWVFIRAIVPNPFKGPPHGDFGVGKDKAKACGFGWQKAPRTDGPEFPSSWVKRVKENEVEKEREALGYQVAILKKEGETDV